MSVGCTAWDSHRVKLSWRSGHQSWKWHDIVCSFLWLSFLYLPFVDICRPDAKVISEKSCNRRPRSMFRCAAASACQVRSHRAMRGVETVIGQRPCTGGFQHGLKLSCTDQKQISVLKASTWSHHKLSCMFDHYISLATSYCVLFESMFHKWHYRSRSVKGLQVLARLVPVLGFPCLPMGCYT